MHAQSSPPPGSFLGRLRRDKRGNTLAIAAVAMIPIIGFAGSAVDMSRLYVVKVRLQQACDSGVLAARKTMTDTSMSNELAGDALTQGKAYFRSNFRDGWFQTNSSDIAMAKASVDTDPNVANAVSGTATATVPMAVMSFFKVQPQALTVKCQAIYDIADADVMFVLDITGSMSCYPSDPENCGGAIFSYTREDGTTAYANTEKASKTENGSTTYSKIESLRQAVVLFDDTVRSSSDKNTQIRYGFVPYTSAVNVGKIIPVGYVQDNQWSYQSRKALDSSSKPKWRFAKLDIPIGDLVRGDEVKNPSMADGSKMKWRGCIEELNTTKASTFDVNNLPDDLDPDIKPTDATNKWRPMLGDLVWARDTTSETTVEDSKVDQSNSYRAGTNKDQNGFPECGPFAKPLGVMSKDEVKNYVYGKDFKAHGGTYHDVGMIWGTRMLAPKGVFAQYTAAENGRKEPTRNIVFMTDGILSPNISVYGMYGIQRLDGRIADTNASLETVKARHTARFRVECDAAKQRGMTVYVVALGTSITDDLKYCASTAQTYQASSTDELKKAFKSIAQRVATLRISQ